MIKGCIAWQSNGLAPPKSVQEATDAYLEAEDALAQWIEECCLTDPQQEDSAGELFASWKVWAEAAGETVGSQKRFSQALEKKGFAKSRIGAKSLRGFKGIAQQTLPR